MEFEFFFRSDEDAEIEDNSELISTLTRSPRSLEPESQRLGVRVRVPLAQALRPGAGRAAASAARQCASLPVPVARQLSPSTCSLQEPRWKPARRTLVSGQVKAMVTAADQAGHWLPRLNMQFEGR